jgi:predicted NUDIX family NTP pyrophosphohydrolase
MPLEAAIDRGFLPAHAGSGSGSSLTKRSAGVLLYRHSAAATPELLIVHMGGPFWRHRDEGSWSIPKGELEDGEEALPAALREFEEELGSPPPSIELIPLGEIRQRSGKQVIAFAGEADFDTDSVHSNTFTTEWPRGSGRQQEFPEIDRAAWVSCDEARVKLVSGQDEFVDRLLGLLETKR